MKETMTSVQAKGSLRRLRKIETMRQVQLRALELFEARGFDTVTIEDVARTTLVSAPTIYRHFGTKEGLVLWDEYDPVLLQTLRDCLRENVIDEAIRMAIVRPLSRIYAVEASRILRRVRLVENHLTLRAAVASNLRELRSEMARVFLSSGVCRKSLEAHVIAGATVTALEVATEHWAQAEGKQPLYVFIERSLRFLRRFAETTSVPTRAGTRGRSR